MPPRDPAARAVPELHFTAQAGRAALPYLRRRLARALPLLPAHRLTEVSVALVGDAQMSALHARSHGDPTPTDVLTYELEHDAKGNVTEGQIVVCVPEARRRCRQHRIAEPRELLLYALHGLLHLVGHDDTTPKAFAKMHALEDQILTAIGVGATFAPAPPKRSGATARRAAPGRAAVARPAGRARG